MDKNQGPLSWLKNLLSKDDQSGKKAGKYQYMIIVLCIGAAFMIAGNVFFKQPTAASDIPAVKQTTPTNSGDVPALGGGNNSSNSVISDYEHEYETELKSALDDMLGVNDVKVIVNVDATDEKIFEKNINTQNQTTDETDSNGGKRTVQDTSTNNQVVIVGNGDNQGPIVVQTKKPAIRGVLVVAKGADNIEVKMSIVEAVTRVLGVPSYRVAVMPEK